MAPLPRQDRRNSAFVASLGVAAVLVIGYLGQILRRRRKD